MTDFDYEEALRKLERNENKDEANRKVYQLIERSLDDNTTYLLFDSGIFKEIVKAYVFSTFYNLGASKDEELGEILSRVLDQLDSDLDSLDSEQVLSYYNSFQARETV